MTPFPAQWFVYWTDVFTVVTLSDKSTETDTAAAAHGYDVSHCAPMAVAARLLIYFPNVAIPCGVCSTPRLRAISRLSHSGTGSSLMVVTTSSTFIAFQSITTPT
jgi:hypothetical protein